MLVYAALQTRHVYWKYWSASTISTLPYRHKRGLGEIRQGKSITNIRIWVDLIIKTIITESELNCGLGG
jgi:hypothetical protein